MGWYMDCRDIDARIANEGVVPESGVQDIYVRGARHIDLCDRGSPGIKDEIQKSIIQFLDR